MQKLLARLDGKKTYLVATLIAIFQVLVQFNVIHLSAHTIALVTALLGAAGLAGLRNAISK